MTTPSASTVLKAFAVLSLFMEREVLSASEAAQMLNAPRSSTLRMLVSLKEAGVVEEADSHRYQLSMRLFELGSFAPLRQDLHDAAGQALLQLVSVTRLPARLAVQDGNEVLFLERLTFGRNDVTADGRRGPLHATANGKALLAFAPPQFQTSYLNRSLEAYTKYTCTNPMRLQAELAQIRQARFAYGRQERRLGFCSLARPVRGRNGRVIASVSIVTPLERTESMRMLEPPLAQACHQIEQRLVQMPIARRPPWDTGRRRELSELLSAAELEAGEQAAQTKAGGSSSTAE